MAEDQKEQRLREVALLYLQGKIDYPEHNRRRDEIKDEYRRAVREWPGGRRARVGG